MKKRGTTDGLID